MKWIKLFGFLEHTSISDTARIAFAYFWVAAELLAKALGFSMFFWHWFLAWNDVFFTVLFELRFSNPKLQLVVLVTIVALLCVYIFITGTLVWICLAATLQRDENRKISVILTENTPWWGARSRRRNTWWNDSNSSDSGSTRQYLTQPG